MTRVLVLEEDGQLRNLAMEMLRAVGFEAVGLPNLVLHLHRGSEDRFGAVLVGSSAGDAHGLAVCAELRRCPVCRDTPLLLIANGEKRRQGGDHMMVAVNLGVRHVLHHPMNAQELGARVSRVLAQQRSGPSLSWDTAQHLAGVLEHHPEVSCHGGRVAELAAGFARWLGCDTLTQRVVRAAGLVHDVGKITVPAAILYKARPLSREEHMRMALHAEYGARLCRLFGLPERVAQIVAQHHERADGSGYPGRLGSAGIRPEVTVVSLADAFDALCEDRAYRAALSAGEALRVLRAEAANGLWDGEVLHEFVEFLRQEPRTAAQVSARGINQLAVGAD
jgi:putative nucleotidyltransferase with HDIG domain